MTIIYIYNYRIGWFTCSSASPCACFHRGRFQLRRPNLVSSCFHHDLSPTFLHGGLDAALQMIPYIDTGSASGHINHHQPQNEDGNNMQQLSRSQRRWWRQRQTTTIVTVRIKDLNDDCGQPGQLKMIKDAKGKEMHGAGQEWYCPNVVPRNWRMIAPKSRLGSSPFWGIIHVLFISISQQTIILCWCYILLLVVVWRRSQCDGDD